MCFHAMCYYTCTTNMEERIKLHSTLKSVPVLPNRDEHGEENSIINFIRNALKALH